MGIFFRLFTLLENACHELDAKGLLQGIEGGKTYEDYLKSFRRCAALEDDVRKSQAEINGLEQLVTIFTITSSISTNPSLLARLGQLQTLLSTKKRKLQDMVTNLISAIVP